MFCYQCEQAAGGTGCTKIGVCGKDEDIQSLQDTLIFALKGIAAYAYHARELGQKDDEVDAFMHEAMFATLTNVDFDLGRYLELVLKAGEMNLRAMEMLKSRLAQVAREEREAQLAEIRGETPPEETVAGTINLWHAWKENEIESLNEVIAAFQAKNPDVEFEVLYVPFDDLRGKFETAAATGGGPTVLIGAADWGPALYDAELVADVSDMTSEEFLRTINPAALGAVKYRNTLIGLPQTIEGVVMYRNTDIIADAPATSAIAAKAAAAGKALWRRSVRR